MQFKPRIEVFNEPGDKGLLQFLNANRPKDSNILEIEWYGNILGTDHLYEVYEFPNKIEFQRWENLEKYLRSKVKDPERTDLIMQYLHNFRTLQVDLSQSPPSIEVVIRDHSDPFGIF